MSIPMPMEERRETRLLPLLWRHARLAVALALPAGALSGLGNIALLVLAERSLRSPEERPILLPLFFATAVIVPCARVAMSAVLVYLSERTMGVIVMRLARRIVAAPLETLECIGSPRLLASLTEDVPTITAGLASMPMLVLNGAILAGCVTYLAWLSWILFAGALACGLIGGAASVLAARLARRHAQRARQFRSELFQHFRTVTDGLKELKLHQERRAEFFSAYLQHASDAYRHSNVKATLAISISTNGFVFLLSVLMGVAVFVLPGWQTLEPTQTATAVALLLFAMGPLREIFGIVPNLSRARVALEHIEALGLSLHPEASSDRPTPWPARPSRLELRRVSHRYTSQQDRAFVLGPIDAAFTAGEIVFITGGNGSGKSTLAKILTGLYVPMSGELVLDGVRIDDRQRESYRQLVSAVFPDFYLFDALVGMSWQEIAERARARLTQLGLDRVVQLRDGAFSTTALSHGQRRRLALLVSSLEDRPICLFDEWAADQDASFRRTFYRELVPELARRGKLVFVISHDEQFFDVATRVLRLQDGRIAQSRELVVDHAV